MPGTIITATSGKGRRRQDDDRGQYCNCALALLGKRVIAVDADIGLRNLDLVLGLENSHHLRFGRCRRGTLPASAGPGA